MTSPAVSTPPAAPGSEGDNGQQQQAAAPGSGAPPQGAENQDPSQSSVQQQQAPASGGGQGDPNGNQQQQDPTPPAPQSQQQQPPRLTQEEWEAQQRDKERQQNLENARKRASELRKNGGVLVRDTLDEIAAKLAVTIPPDLRKPLTDLIDEINGSADTAAQLDVEDRLQDMRATLENTSLEFVRNLPDSETRTKFADMVRGQDEATWVKSYTDLIKPKHVAETRESMITAQAALLPEGEARDGFTSKVKGETDPKKIAQAFHDSLIGVVGPAGEPRVQIRGSASGRPTLAEVTRRRSEGYYKTNEDFLKDQNAALGIESE